MSTGPVLTSASGILSLLDEPDPALQQHALQELNSLVDRFWPEIATAIPRIETLYEDDSFQRRDLAAVVASKVFYHLEELDDALKYALGAGELFDVSDKSEYVETLVAKCIDEYIAQKQNEYNQTHKSHTKPITLATAASPSTTDDSTTAATTAASASSSVVVAAATPIDPRLVTVVERMFQRCYDDGQYHQALGIAIESKRLDQVKQAIRLSPDTRAMLSYAYQLSQSLVLSHGFRQQLLETLVELYEGEGVSDYLNVCQCLLHLNDSGKVATILNELISKEDNDVQSTLLAYQIGFDLGENQNQPFLDRVAAALPTPDAPNADSIAAGATDASKPADAAPSTDAGAAPMDTSEGGAAATASSSATSSTAPSTATASSASPPDSDPTADSYNLRLTRLRSILSGRTATDQYLHFLYQHNATDLNLLKQIKDKLEPRNSVTHNATVMAHSLLHSGTTVDSFLRDNLEWLGKAQNWAKFTATASIGVIHKGHVKESMKLLEPYLPSGGQSGSPYQEGGALYALGLVHCNSQGSEKVDYLSDALRNAGNNEIVQHGACLGLGLCAMASHNDALFEALKGVVMSESAVAGEAAGYAMGLVMLGSGNGVAVEEMIAYAHDTQHEKIIRGLAMGIALIVYGKEEEADVIIEQLITDKDPILRYGAMYAIGLAYACTGNNAAIQRLLHIAVSDVSDDVRRAAVTCLGFVLANLPEQVPRVVALLAASYNPHVRYGSALAVGIACAAGASEKIRREALNVLEPLLKDRVDFVRQGAFIGMAMLLIQHNEKSEPKLALLRKSIADAMAIKSDTMTKLGAILAAGIVDAGGRNVTISQLSASGHKKMAAIVGLALFPQFWYWYPLIHFLSLAFTPTAVIGLNRNLEMPQGFTFVSRAPASSYAYPPPVEMEKKEVKKEVKHNTLSVTAKAKVKAKRKEDEKAKEDGTDKMDVDDEEKKEPQTAAAGTAGAAATVEENKEQVEEKKEEADSKTGETSETSGADSEAKKEKEEKEEKKELPFHVLSNPARTPLPQLATLTWPKQQRYQPVKQQLAGFVMLHDTQPDKAETLVKVKPPKIGVPGVSDDEPEPPAPFQYSG